MPENNNLTEEEYLRRHLEKLEGKSVPTEEEYLRRHLEKSENKPKSLDVKQKITSRTVDLDFQSIDPSLLPCGRFYHSGTTIQVRPATVKEIQAYSMVDDNNFPDIIDKMNDILMNCVRVKYNDDTTSTYLDIKEQDRIYLLFLIRELTFQQGKYLVVNKTCKCKNDIQIELKASNFMFFKLAEKFEKYFDKYTRSFVFEYEGERFSITMPNIGLQKSFTRYITEEIEKGKNPDLSFLKIMPFLLGERNSISTEEIQQELKKFQSMSIDSFQFLNSAISYMKFGIEKLRKICSTCGEEVHTEMVFPNGASGIFVIHDAFDRYFS